MERGSIDIADLDGPFDLQSTVESGQSYLWTRLDDRTYEQTAAYGGDHWYRTVVPRIPDVTTERTVVQVRQQGDVHDGTLEWKASDDAVPVLTHLLRLDDDLDAIIDATPNLPLIDRAVSAYAGMRLTRDPAFPCLISFICSAQMRVERIYAMQHRLRASYGTMIEFDGDTAHAYPTPEQLREATEQELRNLSLGYRAPYVERTAEMVATGAGHPRDVLGLPYEAARESLTQFVGVGEKVADCVLLFSAGYLEAVPLDTWIRSTIADHYPACDRGSYAATSQAIRDQFGGTYAGYAQTYVFHYLRSGGE